MIKPEGPPAPPIPEGASDPLAPQAPHAPQAPQVLQQPIPHMLPWNWSHFKPKFSGKQDKDAEAHLLGANDWMGTHIFQDNDKVQRFCLTLTGDARLWYKSLKPINTDWMGLKLI